MNRLDVLYQRLTQEYPFRDELFVEKALLTGNQTRQSA